MFSERLKELRMKRGITQADLARAIGVGRTSISKYEGKDNIYPSKEVLAIMADYFGVSIDYLIGRSDDASFQNPQEDKITILARGAKKLCEEDQVKLIEVARILFGEAFGDDAGGGSQ